MERGRPKEEATGVSMLTSASVVRKQNFMVTDELPVGGIASGEMLIADC